MRARHTPSLSGEIKIRALSLDSALFPHVGDAITQLTNDWVWEPIGDSVADIVASCKSAVESWYSDMLIGSVQMFLILPPSGWLLLDGTTHDEIDYPELHALLPNQLKTVDDFTLPDMTGSFAAHTETEGEIGGQSGDNIYNLTVGQLPEHSHTYTPPVMTVTAETPTTPVPTADIGAPTATGTAGDGDDIDNRPLNTLLVYAVFAGRE